MSPLKKLVGKKEKTTEAVLILRYLAGLLPFSKIFFGCSEQQSRQLFRAQRNFSEALVLTSVQKYKENCCMSRCLLRTKWLGLKSLHSLNIWEVVFLRSTLIESSISLEVNESVSTTWMESYFCCLRGRAPCLDGLLFASGLYRVPAGWPSLHVRLCVFEEGETLHICYFCSPQMIVGCSLGPY